ncbi:hypothetical protein NQ314_012197 [Rhamnusium bicolor]|uniref:THAP-type domain-containing protein n=1 Tax=Rhamnusium bicolor TaxID=1586634 RepID=A0AAV8XDS4_9CUCU|nr:hypothetical protein NQ314_012197 [Rhamnusium bicolor]
MVNCCYKCGRSNKKDKNITLYNISTNNSSTWHMEFMKRLEIQDINDKDIHICSRHLNPDDIEMINHTWELKESALPVENDEDIEEYVEVKPELVYLKYEGEGDEVVLDSSLESGETRELAPLEPLVEYANVYEDDEEVLSEKYHSRRN